MSLTNRVDKKTLLKYAVEICLALCLTYALYYLASNLGLQYFVLLDRGMVKQTITGPILSSSLDVVVWAVAVFVVLAWLTRYFGLKNVRSNFRSLSTLGVLALLGVAGTGACLAVLGFIGVWSLVLVSGLLLGLCLAFASGLFGVSREGLLLRVMFFGVLLVFFVELASFVLFGVPSALGLEIGVLGSHWSRVELGFANLGYSLLPYAYLLLVFFGLGAFVFRAFPAGWLWLVKRVKAERLVERVSDFFDCGKKELGFEFLRGRFTVVLAVVVSGVVSCLFVLFTVLPWSNPTGMLVGVDSPDYYSWVSHMRSIDVNSALSFALGNDRALFLILCYALSFVAPTAMVIQFSPALLLVLLSVVTVFVLRLFTDSRLVLALGALLVPFSFQSLGLIYSGYFANMLALIFVFAYIVLFFRLLDKWSTLGFAALLGVSVLVLFSHSWTWFIFVVSLGGFLFLEWRSAKGEKKLEGRFEAKTLLIASTVGVGLLIDVFRNVLSPVSSSGSALVTVQSSLGFPNPGYLASGMSKAVDFILGGVFANQLLVALSFLGFLVLLRFKSEVANFLVSWVFAACVSIIFAAEDFVFDRALFMLPWVVFSGLGLTFLIVYVNSKVGLVRGFKDLRFWLAVLFFAFIYLALLNNSLRYLFNINVW